MSHRHEINAIIKQVEAWPLEDRRALTLELLHATAAVSPSPPPRDTLSLAKGIAASVTQPAPNDDEVKQLIGDHRMAKYGGGSR